MLIPNTENRSFPLSVGNNILRYFWAEYIRFVHFLFPLSVHRVNLNTYDGFFYVHDF